MPGIQPRRPTGKHVRAAAHCPPPHAPQGSLGTMQWETGRRGWPGDPVVIYKLETRRDLSPTTPAPLGAPWDLASARMAWRPCLGSTEQGTKPRAPLHGQRRPPPNWTHRQNTRLGQLRGTRMGACACAYVQCSQPAWEAYTCLAAVENIRGRTPETLKFTIFLKSVPNYTQR